MCGRPPAPGRPPAGLQKGGCIRVTSPHPRATDSGGPRGPAQAARGEVSTLYPSTPALCQGLPQTAAGEHPQAPGGPRLPHVHRAPPAGPAPAPRPRACRVSHRPLPPGTASSFQGWWWEPRSHTQTCRWFGALGCLGPQPTGHEWCCVHRTPYPWPRRPVCRLGLRGGSWVPFGNVLTVHPYTEFSLGHWHPPTQSCRWPASRPSAAPGVVSTCLRPHRHRGDGSRTEGGPQGHLGARLSSVPTVRPGLRPAGRDPGRCPPPTCTQRPRPSALPNLGSSRWREWGSRLACQGGSALCWTDRELEVLGDAL